MSYQSNIDIVLALERLQISSFKKQGTIRLKIKLFGKEKRDSSDNSSKEQPLFNLCQPYNIYKTKQSTLPSNKKLMRPQSMSTLMGITSQKQEKMHERTDSYIDEDELCYYSRVFDSQLQSQSHKIEECCYFKKYLNVDEIDQTCFLIRIDLYFKPHGQHTYIVAGYYEGTVHRLSGLCTFLPVYFDEFGSFQLSGVYQATLLQYRFGNQEAKRYEYETFNEYINAATKGFRADKFMDFFNYYRNSLENELTAVQEQHLELLKLIAPNQLYPYTTINPNQAIYDIVSHLETVQRGKKPSMIAITPNSDDLKEKASYEISMDFTSIKALIYQKWNDLITFIGDNLPEVTKHHHDIYKAKEMERLRTHAFSHQVQKNWDWTLCRYEDSGKTYLEQANMDKQKHKEEQLWRDYFPIESKNFFQEQCKNIKLFEEIYQVGGLLLTKRSMSPTEFSKNSSLMKRYVSEAQQKTYSPRMSVGPGINSLHYAKGFGQIAPSRQHLTAGKKMPILPLEKVIPQENKKNKSKHVVIFVHGYQASRQDFILFKNCLEIKYNCRVFISSTNEGRTDESIEMMGKRLAIELNNLFKTVEFGPGTRISFIGHSMGGIIIRSALSYIKNLDSYLYSYMSFSSPHLGYLYEPSALIQAGLWLLNAWEKVQSLDELCMRDSSDARKSLLYRLSQNNSLKSFKNLALISSTQDEYVPYESARIQKNNVLLSKLSYPNPPIIREMVDNLLGDISSNEISRINVIFNIEDKSFDSWVGRTAHVKYLSDQKFVKMFCLIFEKFFI